MAILINPKCNFQVENVNIDPSGRIICIQVSNDQCSKFQVANVYSPTQPSLRGEFFENIVQYTYPTIPLVLASDFIMAEDPWLDKLGSRNTYATIGIKELNKIKKDHSLIDVWRKINPYK